MAEGLVYGVMKQLGSIATKQVQQGIRLVVDVEKEVKKLEDNLKAVVTLLNDAEKRQFTDGTVRRWLEELDDVCYEMEDVADEWNTEWIKEAIQKKEEEENGDVWLQICSFISSLSCCLGQVHEVSRRHDIALKIKELNGKLDEIAERRYRYQLQSTNAPAPEVYKPEITSFVDVSEIYGRQSIKHDLVSILLGKGTEKEKHPHVISLLGMGGIGKTTLAQLAYNDKEVQAHFEIKVWVCVSDPFDQCKVGKAILESAEGQSPNKVGKAILQSAERQSPNVATLQSLLDRICDIFRGKKFFLVFDDVWTEDRAMWQPFIDAFKSCGSQSSRILVTTRKEQVAKMLESANTIKLNELSEEDCWLVFSKIAFFDKDPQQCEQLKGFGRQISKKCKGLPLAANTLGSLMRGKESSEEWENVLKSNLWELEDVERGLFAPLLLSYYDLSSPLKRCFTYCAVFPKDHVFNVDKLVEMWIAHGFVESKRNMELEIKAREYFKNLVIRSFFQECKEYEVYDMWGMSTMNMRYKMHYIVHDFAQSITKARHLGYSTASQFPPFADISKNLRTLIFFVVCDYSMYTLVQNFSRLRVLTLNGLALFGGEILDTIGNLTHLRYLDLSSCAKLLFFSYKWVLPETICNLCNLQFLRLHCNHISVLPPKIGKLINLRLLTGGKLVIPREIGRLTSLRTLDSVLIGEDSERCEFEGLENLNHLRDLSLSFGGPRIQLDRVDRGIIKSNLLIFNALEPPQGLEKLRITYYPGETLSPIWLASLTNLKELRLDFSVQLISLPPLGKILPRLESLAIENMLVGLKEVGVEFLGIESENKKEDIKIFPSLKYLEFYRLWEWEEWIGGTREGGKEDEDCITIMPILQKLIIRYCRKLKSLPDFLRTTPLKELGIIECPIIEEHCRRKTGEVWRNISHVPTIRLLYDP